MQTEPPFRSAAKGIGKPYGHFRENAGLAINQFNESPAGPAKGLCGISDALSERVNVLLVGQFFRGAAGS